MYTKAVSHKSARSCCAPRPQCSCSQYRALLEMRRLPPHWQLDNRSPREVTAVHPQSRHQMIPPSQIDNRSPREVTAVHPQSRHQTPQNQTPQNQTPQNQTPQSRLVRPSVLHRGTAVGAGWTCRHRSRGSSQKLKMER